MRTYAYLMRVVDVCHVVGNPLVSMLLEEWHVVDIERKLRRFDCNVIMGLFQGEVTSRKALFPLSMSLDFLKE